ncbi:MAG: hypothetical protein LBB67_03945 [Oscillospiraceae bacterium]|jgi:hypothetical protein|nr:hypothetical protein [Oscillospiraceae bacterium]
MKKTGLTLAALLLTFAMVFAFVACDSSKSVDATTSAPSETETETETYLTDPIIDTVTDPVDESITDVSDVSDLSGESLTAIDPSAPSGGTSTTTAVVTTLAGKDPTKMNKEELLNYFNTAANLVATAKPGYTYIVQDKIENPKTKGGIGSLINPLIPAIIKELMPGDEEVRTIKKGSDNYGDFMSRNASDKRPSSLRVSDLSSITAVKQGANYVVTVKLPNCTNPADDAKSGLSRCQEMQTPEQLLESLAGGSSPVSGEAKNVTLVYKNIQVILTVDPAGHVQYMKGTFNVDAVGTDLSIIGLGGITFTADQVHRMEAKNFKW